MHSLHPKIIHRHFDNSKEDATRIIELVRGIPCKINLLTFNPHQGSQFRPTSEEKMIEFRNILAEGGCVVFMRSSRGDDRMAACGQLGEPGEIQPPRLRPPPRFLMASWLVLEWDLLLPFLYICKTLHFIFKVCFHGFSSWIASLWLFMKFWMLFSKFSIIHIML